MIRLRGHGGQTVLGALVLALVVPGLWPYLQPLRQSTPVGPPVSVAGSVLPVPANARPCVLDVNRSAERAIPATLHAYCLPSTVSSEALARWADAQVPPYRSLGTTPWCDRQLLSDGAVLDRWGTARTFGWIRSDPRQGPAWLLLLDGGNACR